MRHASVVPSPTRTTQPTRRDHLVRWAVVLGPVAVAALAVAFVAQLMVGGSSALASGRALARRAAVTAAPRGCSPEPDFVGMTLKATEALARRCHYQLAFIYRLPDPHPAGIVVAQSPDSSRVVVSTGPLGNQSSVLRGASSPPVAAECDTTLSLGEDGSVAPVTCGANHVNVEAWDYYALLRPPVMSLPRRSATCYIAGYVPLTEVTTPIDLDVAEIAKAYNGWRIPDALIAHIFALGPPYRDHCALFTPTVTVAPVDGAGRVAYGFLTAQTLGGTCVSGSVVEGAAYTCSSPKAHLYACWRGHTVARGPAQAVCLADPWSMRVTVVVTATLPAPRAREHGLPWGLETNSGLHCQLVAGEPARYLGQLVAYNCDEPWQELTPGVRLLGDLDEHAPLWKVPSVRVTPSGYVSGPKEAIAGAWFGTAAL